MECGLAVLPFSPMGRRWPEGSDEGVAPTERLYFRPPSSACRHLLPAGEKGMGHWFPSYKNCLENAVPAGMPSLSGLRKKQAPACPDRSNAAFA